ncbi:MAG: protein translocase subunit secF, partial [Acidimicrobiaceae bacterium]|nr:protein translocase subunit secF [Acidimicrobiaceae bacterium]
MSPERIRPGSARTQRPPEAPDGSSGEAASPDEAVASEPESPRQARPVEERAARDRTVRTRGARNRAAEVPAADEGEPGEAPGDPSWMPEPSAGEAELAAVAFEEAEEQHAGVSPNELVLEPAPGDPTEEQVARRSGRSRSRATVPSPLEENGTGEQTDEDEDLVVLAARASDPHMSWYRRVYYGRTHIDFVGRRRLWFGISLALILAGAISLGVRGLNLGIEFSGGTSWTFPAQVRGAPNQTAAVNATRTAITRYGLGGATITVLGVGNNATIQVQAKLASNGGAAASTRLENEVSSALAKLDGISANQVSVESVGPSWGSSITNKAIEALIVFLVFIALYISIFFEWRMAFAAIIAVAHDVMVTVGIYSLAGLVVTPDTVVAFLTILGYSLYDTIVVFDRVRDNIRHLGTSNKLTISDIVNLSMNQTLARSINTSLVAILPILAVLVLGAEILGATTLQYFGFALLIGLTSGAYSSIFIASPIVAMLKEREPRWSAVRERLAQRGGARLLLSPADIAAGILTSEGTLQRPTRERQRP